MERPTRRSATAANAMNGTSNSSSSNGTSRRRRRREAERDSGAVSDGGDTDSSAVAVEMGTAVRASKASTSKKSSRATTTRGKATGGGADVDADASEADHADADSEDLAHDDDAHGEKPDDEADARGPPPVVGYATRARRERSQSVVSTASDSASSVASTRHGAEEEEDEDDDDGRDAPTRAELHTEKLAELEKKKKMVEDGSLAEYCRRVAEFKEERNRLLQSAEWHKNLQLKNTVDLHGFEVQRAHNIWADSRERLKREMMGRADALLAKLRGELAALEQTGKLPMHVVAPKKTFVLPPRKAAAAAAPTSVPAPVTTTTDAADARSDGQVTPEKATDEKATPRHPESSTPQQYDDGKNADEEAGDGTPQKRRKVGAAAPASAPVPPNVLRLQLDDISSDLAAIMNAREAASSQIHAALPAPRLELRVDRRRLMCGKYVFEEGDEVVVTAPVLKEDYVGVISSVSVEELYIKLSTGQKARVAVEHIAHRRCEIRPFLRGSAGIQSLQSSGWVECEPF